MNKKRLGKGLGALLPADGATTEQMDPHTRIIEMNIDDIEPNPFQPRREFDEELLTELAQSIAEHGVIQPITIRKVGETIQLVAGERRLRAAKRAGLLTIPTVEKDYNDQQMMEIALIENIQREDLNPIEEALAYKSLMEQFALTQEDVSTKVGKSRSAIANTIRLLNLPQMIQDYVSRETLSMGHARALLGLSTEEEMLDVCEICIRQGMTVRHLEDYIKILKNERLQNASKAKKAIKKDDALLLAQTKLKDRLGANVKIDGNDKKAKITIECSGMDDLHRVLKLLEE